MARDEIIYFKESGGLVKAKGKNYCILALLKNIELIEPFSIDKTGYGVSTAWIVAESIENLKRI